MSLALPDLASKLLAPRFGSRRPPARGVQLTWAVLAAIAVLAGVLAAAGYHGWHDRGLTVAIQFQNAHGLRPGADIRYRGVVIGRVTEVHLRSDLSGADVRANLTPGGESLAREGSRFWIVRPSVSLATGVSGLDTVVADNYLAVRPSDSGQPAVAFVGDEECPVPDPAPESLAIVLKAKRRSFALRPGAPITCCGTPIGLIRRVDLAEDGKGVRAQADIDAAHARLVSGKARFYETEVARPEANLAKMSFKLRFDLQAVGGGVELEVPDSPGPTVASGHMFDLADSPERR